MAELLKSLQELALVVGIVLIVAGVGLSATWGEATALFKQPGPLVRSLIAMNVVAPVVACLMALAFGLRPPVQIALVAVAVSPVPPFLPKQTSGGHRSYAIGLLAATSLLAVAFVPLVLSVLEHVLPYRSRSPQRRSLHSSASRCSCPCSWGSQCGPLFRAGGAPREAGEPVGWRSSSHRHRGRACARRTGIWRLVGSGTLIAMVAYVLMALVVGNVLGGPNRGTRSTLGISTASRHPGVALAVATANFPNEDLILPSILLMTAIAALLTWAYANSMARRKR